MKNNYFVLLVIFLTWHFLQSWVQSCHRFKGRALPHPACVQQFHSAIHTNGSYTVKRQKKSAESGKHIDNPVHQTILHFLYAPFISDKKAAERFMSKWFPQLSCSSLGRWLKRWAALSWGPLHPPVLPCSSSGKLISSISWVVFGSLDEGWMDYWEIKGQISFCFSLECSGSPTRVAPPATPKVGRLGRCSTICLLSSLECREHPSHNCGEDSCSWGAQRSETFRFLITQPKTSVSQWKMSMQKLSNDYVCAGTTSVHDIIHFHSELVLQLMIYKYYPPGQHRDFFLQGYKGWDLNQHSGTNQIQTCNPISTDCKLGPGRCGNGAPSLCHTVLPCILLYDNSRTWFFRVENDLVFLWPLSKATWATLL